MTTNSPSAPPAPAIRIGPGEHAVFIGLSGSGKTTLARRLIEPLQRLIVVDPKNEIRGEGFKRQLALRWWWKDFRLVWRVPRGKEHDARLSGLLYTALRRRNLTIYIDELTTLAAFFPRSTDTAADIVRVGREPRVRMWASMQRPFNVPRYFLSEGHHKFIFCLLDEEDRDRAAGLIGGAAREELPMPTRDYSTFLYRGPALTAARKFRYYLKADRIEAVLATERDEPLIEERLP